MNKFLLIPATLNNIFDKNCQKSSKFCNVFFNFVSFFTLSRSLIMDHIFTRKVTAISMLWQNAKWYKEKSSLRTFFPKIQKFQMLNEMDWKIWTKVSEVWKNQICHTQIFQNTAYQTCNFLPGNLLSLSVIKEIVKYIYWQNY